MKKLVLILATLLSSLHSMAQHCEVKGYIKDYTPSKIYLFVYEGAKIHRDSALVNNGHFDFKVNIKESLAARLVTRDPNKKIFDAIANSSIPAQSLLFFVEPGQKINITADYEDWPIAKIEGGENNTLLSNYYLKNKNNLLNARKAMSEAFLKKNAKDSIGHQVKEKEFLTLEGLNDKEFEHLTITYPSSLVTAYNIYTSLNFINDETKLKKLYHPFEKVNVNSVYAEAIRKRLFDLNNSAVGTMVKSFSVPGKDSLIRIDSFRGKYVLLDFWGSWCVPCRESHPHLKDLYAKYKNKGFEIIGIAYEKGEKGKEDWLKAIKADQLPWINILNNDVKDKYQDLISLFAIKSYPTKILIDPRGKIILKPQYGTMELDNLLKEVLK
ncbi:MAG: TlpA disulfide reductase family protein [Bacteroidota bacterium]